MKHNKHNQSKSVLEDGVTPWGEESQQQPIQHFQRTGQISKNSKTVQSLPKRQFSSTTPRLYPKKEKASDDWKSIVKTLSLTFNPEFPRHKNIAGSRINLQANRGNYKSLVQIQSQLRKYRTISQLETLSSCRLLEDGQLSPLEKASKKAIIFSRQRFFRSLHDRSNRNGTRQAKFRDVFSVMRITLKRSDKEKKMLRKTEREYFRSVWDSRQPIV